MAGEKLAGFGLTEPGAGSDAGATRTKAELVGGEWVVNGAKQFITNSGSEITSLVTVTARTGDARGRPAGDLARSSCPTGTPGLHRREGLRQARLARLRHPSADASRTCRVPEDHLLGERGRGFAQFLATLDDGRVAIAALAVGCIQACLDVSVAVRRRAADLRRPDRPQAGCGLPDRRPRGDARRRAPADLQGRRDEGRHGGRARRATKDFKQAAAVAKLYSTESAVTATRIATQVFGGYGFMEEYPVARFYRDAKVLEIGEGTSEVQRMLIARGLGLPVE